MSFVIHAIADEVNAILKSRVRVNFKHGSVGVVIVTQLLINISKIKGKVL